VQDDQGFQFRVSASTPQLVAEVSVTYPGTFSPQQMIAPPGKDFITIVLHVANAASDRPERAPIVSALASPLPYAPLLLAAPTADMGAFGYSGCPPAFRFHGALPADVCSIANSGYVYVTNANAAPDLPIGGSEDLLLFVNQPVSSSAPVGHITVYWVNGPVENERDIAIRTPAQ
jgi:hypothetical protein